MPQRHDSQPASIDLNQMSCYLIRPVGRCITSVSRSLEQKHNEQRCTHTCKHTHIFFSLQLCAVSTQQGLRHRLPPHAKTSHLCLFFSTPATCMKVASLSVRSAPFMPLCSLLSKSSCCASYGFVAFGSVTPQQFKIPPVACVLLSSAALLS